jgi:hypothetical protein
MPGRAASEQSGGWDLEKAGWPAEDRALPHQTVSPMDEEPDPCEVVQDADAGAPVQEVPALESRSRRSCGRRYGMRLEEGRTALEFEAYSRMSGAPGRSWTFFAALMWGEGGNRTRQGRAQSEGEDSGRDEGEE